MPRIISFLAFLFVILAPVGCLNKVDVNRPSVSDFSCLNDKFKKNIAGLPNIASSTTRCIDYKFDEKNLAYAIKLFVSEYSREFDVDELKVWSYFYGLEIESSIYPREVQAAYDSKGNLLEGIVPVSGLALSKDKIWVEIRTSHIYTSSLVHELIHVIIWNENLGIHGDPDHEGKNFSGWSKKHTKFIKKINLMLQDLDV
tara:strand:- start:168 stop:767 length:600 start_codon:yes stop_codon:yes gene_type:complete